MEKIYRFIAYHLPKRLVYYAAIRVVAYSTTGKYSSQIVPNLTMIDAVDRWSKQYERQ